MASPLTHAILSYSMPSYAIPFVPLISSLLFSLVLYQWTLFCALSVAGTGVESSCWEKEKRRWRRRWRGGNRSAIIYPISLWGWSGASMEIEEGRNERVREEWKRDEGKGGGREWKCWWSLVLQLAADRLTNSTKLAWWLMFHDRLCQSAAENLRLYDTTVSQPILIHCSRHLPSDLLPLFHSFFHSNIF